MSFKENIKRLYIFNFVASFCLICAVIVPFYTEWGHLNFTQIMILQSWFMFWTFVLQIPTGALADKLGRKKVLVLGLLSGILANIIYVTIPNFLVFMIAEFFFGLSASLFTGSEDALLYDTLKATGMIHRSKSILGRFASFGLLSLALGSLTSGILVKFIGLRLLMLFSAVPYVLSLFILITIKEPPIYRREIIKIKSIIKNTTKLLRGIYPLKIIAVDFIIISIVSYFLWWLYQPLLQNINIDLKYFGIALFSISIIEIILMLNYERLEKILGSKKSLTVMTSALTGLFAILSIGSAFVGLRLFAFVFITLAAGIGLGRRPLMINYLNKYIPPEIRATALSTFGMIRTLSLMILNPVIGWLADWSIELTILAIGIIAVIFSILSRIEEKHLLD